MVYVRKSVAQPQQDVISLSPRFGRDDDTRKMSPSLSVSQSHPDQAKKPSEPRGSCSFETNHQNPLRFCMIHEYRRSRVSQTLSPKSTVMTCPLARAGFRHYLFFFSSSSAFLERLIRPLSSISVTLTMISSPSWTMSSGFSTLWRAS